MRNPGSINPRNLPYLLPVCLTVLIVGLVLVAPLFFSYEYYQQDLSICDQPPSGEHPMGTDSLGRDLLARVGYGLRISLSLGVITALGVVLIGVPYGMLSGMLGGWVDEIAMRLIDAINTVPTALYIILLVAVRPGLESLIAALVLTSWMPLARVVRGQALKLKEERFVEAARILGASQWRIAARHILPHTLGTTAAMAAIAIPEAIFTEAWLSFLGLGVQAPAASLGTLVSDGFGALRTSPWQLLFPSLVLFLVIYGFNTLSGVIEPEKG
ncbi:MAG: ABC transporter permease [Firmicutes bacterium]|nr:ABC transporter permease [Bacillota bacterium]